ncbi:hypothetical protein OV079_03645 [Nannocystis pusilla]|uniref:Uncharacterized protein n=1 Tax=Nannocystis pusilla TaxID=889268 RepID=A0A9X3IU35_9BACT|nr:hypothetical protein [Nannocystis pusilla]MCY1004677.1 hypothetical protein [Nannocystis pusilla]
MSSSPAPAPTPEPPRLSLPDSEPAWALTRDDVLLQLEHEPTFVIISAGDPTRPFGRVPAFTLYRDGTVLFTRDSEQRRGLFRYSVFEWAARDHIEHVRALGVARMRSYLDECNPAPHRPVCAADASITILRTRLPDGSLHEVRNYNGFAARLAAQLHAVYDRIARLAAPRTGVDLYLPHAATLFVRRIAAPSDLDDAELARARPWPLDADWLSRTAASGAQVIEIPQIRAIIAATGTNTPHNQLFVLGEAFVRVSMVPWLPGHDHRAALDRRDMPR